MLHDQILDFLSILAILVLVIVLAVWLIGSAVEKE